MSVTPRRASKERVAPPLGPLPAPDGVPGGFLFHSARVLLLLLLAVLVAALFPRSTRVDVGRYQLGMVAEEDVIAEFAFPVPKSADELAREQIEAAATVPATFDFHPEAADSMRTAIERFLDQVEQVADDAPAGDGFRALFSRVGIPLSADQVDLLTNSSVRAELRQAALDAVDRWLPGGVLESWEPGVTRVDEIKISEPGEPDRYVSIDEVLTSSDFYERAVRSLPVILSIPAGQALVRVVLINNMRPSLVLDEQATESEKEQVRAAVPRTKANILAGEAIVRANQQITAEEIERLNAYREQQRNLGLATEEPFDLSTLFGSLLYAIVVLGIYGLMLYLYRTEIYLNYRWLLLQAMLVATYVLIAAVVGRQQLPPELLPIAFVALAVAVLWDGRLALLLAVLLAVLTGGLPPFQGTSAGAVTLVAGAAAAMSVRVVRRRSQFWVFVGVITLGYGVVAITMGLINALPPGDMLLAVGWGIASATASAFAVLGFLAGFEWFTGITTDQTLLEWADPTRNLLSRLSREAPGTYAHTIGVANLCEAAANSIGAQGLLCRVGAYYHDVGKMLKPQYFIENQPSGRNPHDRLKPATSASIVREHVTEGLRLAREDRVPEVICDFIAEHHGTQRIGFFYEKALEEAEPGEDVDMRAFSYPGPRPHSKETAILMIADSLESATRALQDTTPERIGQLVESIVQNKIDDGQLDDAPLTLQEIAAIKEQFITVLTGMYHTRIDYPQTRHLTGSPSRQKATT